MFITTAAKLAKIFGLCEFYVADIAAAPFAGDVEYHDGGDEDGEYCRQYKKLVGSGDAVSEDVAADVLHQLHAPERPDCLHESQYEGHPRYENHHDVGTEAVDVFLAHYLFVVDDGEQEDAYKWQYQAVESLSHDDCRHWLHLQESEDESDAEYGV